MLKQPTRDASDGKGRYQILFLTLAEVDDRSFGGAIRSNDIRSALLQSGDVHTLVIHGAGRFSIDLSSGDFAVRRATFTEAGFSFRALLQRRRIAKWVAEILELKSYDVIVARYLGLALYVPFKYWSRLVLDADDIFKTPAASKSSSRAGRIKFGLRNALAALLLRLPRHVWLVNPLDGARLRTRAVSQLPNAVTLPALVRVTEPPIPGRILMVGYFEHPPNAEGLEWFATAVMPRLVEQFPHVELHAVGKAPAQLAQRFSGPVVVRGFVADLAIEYARADIVIAPIRSGGGTQIKVLEALAYGRPLIASVFSHGGFAEHIIPREHLLIAGTDKEWLDATEWALRNPGEFESMAAAGQRIVRHVYGTDRMEVEVRRTLDELVGRVGCD